MEALQAALIEIETVLSDKYVATPKTRKTRTPRTPLEGSSDNTAPNKAGRPKKTAA